MCAHKLILGLAFCIIGASVMAGTMNLAINQVVVTDYC